MQYYCIIKFLTMYKKLNLMKVAYIFRNNMARIFQLATMILPQLETNTHLVNVLKCKNIFI